jgi:opacity protein-like surface antigen
MLMKSAAAVMALSAALLSGAASAQLQPRSFYAGANLGQSKAQRWCLGAGSTSCDDTSAALKLFGGYQLDETFAIEAGYVHLGTFKANAGGASDEAKAQALEASIVATWPVAPRLGLFGRIGTYRANVRETTSFIGTSSNNNTDLTFGLGVRYDISPKLALRGEWQRYLDMGGRNVALGTGAGDLSSVDVLGVGVLWRF